MNGSDSTASVFTSRLTNDGVVSACPTCHSSFAANMACESRMYDYILEIGISIRIQPREDEELLFAIHGSHYGSQL